MKHRFVVASGLSIAITSVGACISNPALPPTEDAGTFDAGFTPPVSLDAGIDSTVPSASDAGHDAGAIPGQDGGPGVDGACAVQAALSDLGADAGGSVVANDFTCPEGIDLDASTATLDFTGTGFARAPQAFAFESFGDGGEGDYASDAGPLPDGGQATIAAGVHQFSSFTFSGSSLYSNGDLTLNVAGPVAILANAYLYVNGNLVIVASGPIAIDGILEVGGNVTIHQPTAAGIAIGSFSDPITGTQVGGVYTSTEAARSTPLIVATTPGDIDIATRGAVKVPDGYMYSGGLGTGAAARSGNITVRSYAGFSLGGTTDAGSTYSSYFYVGDAPCAATTDAGACTQYGANGELKIETEGDLALLNSYLYAGNTANGPTGGDLFLQAGGSVTLGDSSYLYSGGNGSLDIRAQGDVTFSNDSFGYSGSGAAGASVPTNVVVRGRTVSLTVDSFLYAGGQAGTLTLQASGDVTLDQSSYVFGGNSSCAPGGAAVVQAEGNIAVTNGAYVAGGDSTNGSLPDGGACTPGAGGGVTLRARGTVNAPMPDGGPLSMRGGSGSTTGAVSATPAAAVAIGLLDSRLEPSVTVVSLPMTASSAALLYGAVGATAPPAFIGAHVLVSPDGTAGAFAPMTDAVGAALQTGWRYELLLQPRMFDPSAADGIVVRVQ
jgi:hypothetical protein